MQLKIKMAYKSAHLSLRLGPLTLSAIFLLAVLPGLADTYNDQGIKLYNSGEYAKAAKYFSRSLQNKPNSTALYYGACCCLKLGQVAKAKNAFQLLVDNYPNTAEAKLAQTAVNSLGTQTNAAHLANNNRAQQTQEKNADPAEQKTLINDPLADKLISVYRHTENTDRIIDIVKRGLSRVPNHVKTVLVDNGYQILIAPMTMDVTDTQEGNPRGYTHGGGWDNAGGVFQPGNKRIVVGERVSWRSNPPTLNNRAAATVRHEMGHAYDQYLGRSLVNSWTISSTPLFRQTYANDAQVFTNSQRRAFEYYVQPDGAGENELFAELFYRSCLADNENSKRAQSAEDLAEAFPKTFKLVQDLIEQVGLDRFSSSD